MRSNTALTRTAKKRAVWDSLREPLPLPKEEPVQPQARSTLAVIYENWRGYHEKLRDCIAPLTNEQLLVQPAARMWPLGQIVQHIGMNGLRTLDL